MNTKNIPDEIPMATEGVCTLALECWRLRRISELVKHGNEAAGIRHVVRRLTEILEVMGIKMVEFTGRTYDPGMVPEVVEVRQDREQSDGLAVIDETIAPTVTWHGQVVRPGQITLRRSPTGPQDSTEVAE